ncbi:GNVR domain-containing protein [Algoriphagus winogradskyi]|uniref:Chain length determinant protein n=1 Tax=Algoriphagus winogradskyi TaxID=237017 RepID=A0ABY1NYD2_9BACT|nr:GNVR domain-containing protein [Algoriphagus winogradskyi]SMP20104.1 Chain length determinant protein [Algoriphagus winogradskyi]
MPTNEQSKVELNYIELIQKILSFKKRLLVFTLAGLILGLLIATTSPKEFTSSSLVILEENENSGQFGQMGALAGLAGISLPQMQGDQTMLSSELFPDVIHSRDFLLSIMKEKFFFQTKGKEMTLEEYYAEERPGNIVKKTIDFVFSIPARIIGLFSSNEISRASPITTDSEAVELGYVSVTSQENYVLKQLKERITIENEIKLIQLDVSMPEPLISAEVNALVLERLIEYVTNYKTVKQKINLEFVEDRVDEAQVKFQEAQLKLASYRDSNQGMISRRAMTKEEQLQLEFNLTFNIYNTLKQELEQSTIQLKRETPVFTIMEKASVPLGPSKPNKPLIIVFSMFLGFLVGVLYAIYRVLLTQISQ